jgi:Amidohydrolase family
MAAMDREAPRRADLIVRNAKVTTLHDGGSAVAEAVAVLGERFAAVGGEAEVMRLAGEDAQVVDAGGRRVIPGLNDSHLHAIRGGLLYNLELRWDGVGSLDRGLEMIREQAVAGPRRVLSGPRDGCSGGDPSGTPVSGGASLAIQRAVEVGGCLGPAIVLIWPGSRLPACCANCVRGARIFGQTGSCAYDRSGRVPSRVRPAGPYVLGSR